jgi:hypothetical protein
VIKAKSGKCLDCSPNEPEKPLIAGRCQSHYWKHRSGQSKTKEALAKPKKKFKVVSDKQAKRLAEYRKKRDNYFKENPVCEYPECCSTDIQLHHKRGRIGALLSDERYFCSLCDKHHKFVELNPVVAKAMGLSMDRLSLK